MIPTKDMVVAHMNYGIEEPPERDVNHFQYQTILQMLLDAHCGDGCR